LRLPGIDPLRGEPIHKFHADWITNGQGKTPEVGAEGVDGGGADRQRMAEVVGVYFITPDLNAGGDGGREDAEEEHGSEHSGDGNGEEA
jgi:hypothetical protein